MNAWIVRRSEYNKQRKESCKKGRTEVGLFGIEDGVLEPSLPDPAEACESPPVGRCGLTKGV
jgi:hypothetical protein